MADEPVDFATRMRLAKKLLAQILAAPEDERAAFLDDLLRRTIDNSLELGQRKGMMEGMKSGILAATHGVQAQVADRLARYAAIANDEAHTDSLATRIREDSAKSGITIPDGMLPYLPIVNKIVAGVLNGFAQTLKTDGFDAKVMTIDAKTGKIVEHTEDDDEPPTGAAPADA